MAKDQRILSDEDIVRLRDDAAYPDRVQALGSPQVRRALAEARLRALAISLSGKDSSHHENRAPNDDELLEYLLADMPEDRRRDIESRLRGNLIAFERLVKLHELTSAHANHRDLRHADMAERNIERHDLGSFEVRIRTDRLVFRRMDDQSLSFPSRSLEKLFALEMPGAAASRVNNYPDEDTLEQIEVLLSRCSEMAAKIRQLRNETGVGDPNEFRKSKGGGWLQTAEVELAQMIQRLQHFGRLLELESMVAQKLGPQPKIPSRQKSRRSAELLSSKQMQPRPLLRRSESLGSDWDGDWQGCAAR